MRSSIYEIATGKIHSILFRPINVIIYISVLTLCQISCEYESAIVINAKNPRRLSAGNDLSVPGNSVVYLNAKTYSLLETELTIKWQQSSGTTVALNNPTSAYANFLTPQVFVTEDLTFTVTSTDGIHPVITDEVTISVYPVVDITMAEFSFSHLPTIAQTFSLTITNPDNFGYLYWKLTKKPSNARNTNMVVSRDRKSVHFTPDSAGLYEITISSDTNESERKISFYIKQELPFDPMKIQGFTDMETIDQVMGIITNQSWISSNHKDKTSLKKLIQEHDSLTIIGHDEQKGFLIEYNEADTTTKRALENLRQSWGVRPIFNRYYEGESITKTESTLFYTNDYEKWNTIPDGENWHLEKIQAPEAWQISTGNPDVLIGVSDGGFATTHPELSNKIRENLADSDNDAFSDHGNSVAGTIIAIANNQEGIAGINWQSQAILAKNFYNSINALTQYSQIKVISSSWAIPGYIDKEFDPKNARQVNTRKSQAITASRQYRNLAASHPDKLFIWSSGNGINNGKGYQGIYAIPGYLHSPALHLLDNYDLSIQENVIFIAAMDINNRLYYYSNYGELVELAAPSHFKSLTTDNYSNFLGTSAAAPVVAGVASLIYSLHPEFTGKEVKDILINSSTKKVTHRKLSPLDTRVEPLTHSIPIVNAHEALIYAKNIINSKVKLHYTLPDPFIKQARISFIPFLPENTVVHANVAVSNQLEPMINQFESYLDASDTVFANLNIESNRFNLSSDLTITNNEETQQVKLESLLFTAGIKMAIQDRKTGDRLSNVKVSLENENINEVYASGYTNLEGEAQIWLKQGSYRLHIQSMNYKPASKAFTISHEDNLTITIDLIGKDSKDIGSLDGIIVDKNNAPIDDAYIRLSGGEQTNGFFLTTQTNESGIYSFPKLDNNDMNNEPIEEYTMEVSALNYESKIDTVNIIPGFQRTKNITLLPVSASRHLVFQDDFEIKNNWSASGLWRRINLHDRNTRNLAVDQGYSLLPADTGAESALLPLPSDGRFAWWYGHPDKGNYISIQHDNDYIKSGGTSTSEHSGTLITPPIKLPKNTELTLTFDTWWEIEAMTPNRKHYDIMEISISTNGGDKFHVISVLNAYHHSLLKSREGIPMSTAGINKEPIWLKEQISLTPYSGETIQIKFLFDTVDELHNGYRGWIIDNLEIKPANQ